jgi:hypothetical protein
MEIRPTPEMISEWASNAGLFLENLLIIMDWFIKK